ncbi:MAG TPA: hypothetical protein VHL99_06865 [Candidatus Binatia bacterium]|jgi:hypothetical protein|nr:hypothetical protein [Candidatus Binatia bacterium]
MRNLTAAVLFIPALTLGACSSADIVLANPRTGATVRCGGSGWGLFAPAASGMVDECMRRYPDYVPVDRLTPGERADLERRGAAPY